MAKSSGGSGSRSGGRGGGGDTSGASPSGGLRIGESRSGVGERWGANWSVERTGRSKFRVFTSRGEKTFYVSERSADIARRQVDRFLRDNA